MIFRQLSLTDSLSLLQIDSESLAISLPSQMDTQPPSESELEAYKKSLSAQEQLVLEIADDHLESSFDLGKSIGFKQWREKASVATSTTGH